MAKIAREFEGYVDEMLQVRRAAGAQASDDITARLLRQLVGDRPLRNAEIVSILRNWTVGEVGTISAAIGILVHYLAEHGDLQQRLRDRPSLLPAAIEEILRIHRAAAGQSTHRDPCGGNRRPDDRCRRTGRCSGPLPIGTVAFSKIRRHFAWIVIRPRICAWNSSKFEQLETSRNVPPSRDPGDQTSMSYVLAEPNPKSAGAKLDHAIM